MTRSPSGWLFALTTLIGAVVPAAAAASPPAWVFVGTYTDGAESKGIYRVAFDAETGRATPPEVAAELANPSFLAVHPSGRALFAVSELYGGPTPGGQATAFTIDPDDGSLALVNAQPSAGAGPCFAAVDPTGRNLLVANYGSGSAAALPIGADFRLDPPSSVVQHEGRGANPQRQEGPHAHSIYPAPGNQFALVADLGLDKLFVYRFDATAHTLAPNDPPFVALPPGAGPRHLAFHPNGRLAFVVNELACTVVSLSFDAKTGALAPIQTASTLPEGFQGENTCADIHVHPSGQFVFASNRGHDSIAAFRVDAETGALASIGCTPTGGKTPRNFALDPSGKWLLAANQGSGSIVVFAVDAETGRLTPTGEHIAVPKPVCVRFLAPSP